MGQTIEKLLQTGARLSSEAHEVVRIPGLLTDADMIGRGVQGGNPAAGCLLARCRCATLYLLVLACGLLLTFTFSRHSASGCL